MMLLLAPLGSGLWSGLGLGCGILPITAIIGLFTAAAVGGVGCYFLLFKQISESGNVALTLL